MSNIYHISLELHPERHESQIRMISSTCKLDRELFVLTNHTSLTSEVCRKSDSTSNKIRLGKEL